MMANLGFKNDIVKVRDGYGRNYLLPQKIAIIANESNKKQLAENLKQQAHKAAKILADAQALEAKLAETVIEVKVKANEDGKIFGTVTTQNIADALKGEKQRNGYRMGSGGCRESGPPEKSVVPSTRFLERLNCLC